ARNCLGKLSTEIGILIAAVSSPPTGVDAQLHQIGEASDLLGAWRRAPWEIAELIQVDWPLALRFQVGAKKGYVAYFIVSVIRDVLGHITIKLLKGCDVGLTRSAGHFDVSELSILLPEIGGAKYSSRNLEEDRKQESLRPRRARGTSPCSETPWTKRSSASILPHSMKQWLLHSHSAIHWNQQNSYTGITFLFNCSCSSNCITRRLISSRVRRTESIP
ncbi:MAG: hypothetical protein QOE55_2687, partial [Acidobacteriaceae bacterium]|nr:hypothetical protein [Acidobacteriaceae bacterium]